MFPENCNRGTTMTSITWILFDPRLRNLRLLRAARAAIGTLVRKLLDRSSSTRLTRPEMETIV